MRHSLRALTVGSSLVVTIFPLAGMFIASRHLPLDVVDWRSVFLGITLSFGVANVITLRVLNATTRLRFGVCGALLGLALASVGTFVSNIPELIYGLEGSARYIALLGGPVFYGAVWAFVMYPVDSLFGLLPAAAGPHD